MTTPQTYSAKYLSPTPVIDASWDKPQWKDVPALRTEHYMGESPEHRPSVEAKVGYDSENIYVIFKVEDNYIRAVAKEHQGDVWKDSCCEFFFTPGMDVVDGYFNLEINCGGTMLLHFNKAPKVDTVNVAPEDLELIELAHTLPKIIEPEIAQPTTWCLEYRLPISILKNYTQVEQPKLGACWRANFYKCGDETSHPHWLSWAKIDEPKPNFHVPEAFGVLEFC